MRWIVTLSIFVASAVAFCQSPFTIVRPLEGSKVREKVQVLFPKNSVPPGGYVGIYVDGKMIEAVKPSVSGKYCSYTLDTKERGLKDGRSKLEIVLFVDYNDQPRIEGRSSVNVIVSNKSNIKVPAAGIKLRYVFRPGTETVYDYYHRLGVANVTEDQIRRGRAGLVPLDAQELRMVYAVDNRYENGDGLVRLQALPPKGQRSVFLQTTLNPAGRNYAETEFGQMYQRLTTTGNEVFGTAPENFAMEGTTAEPVQTSVYVLEPLPTLPPQAVRPGDAWQTRFQEDAINLQDIHSQNSLVKPIPARGEFVGVEWEMGHPCAKLHQVVAANEPGTTNHISIEETIWFALDRGVILKIIRSVVLDRPSNESKSGVTSGSFKGQISPKGAGGRGPSAGAPGVPPSVPGAGDGSTGFNTPLSPLDIAQNNYGTGKKFFGSGFSRDGKGSSANGQAGAASTATPVGAIQRIVIEDTFVLEG